jgi:hypothetical protein
MNVVHSTPLQSFETLFKFTFSISELQSAGRKQNTSSYLWSYTMKVVETKNWSARINKMSSVVDAGLTITGTVIVGNSATEAVLVLPSVQDMSMGLRLELKLEQRGAGATALTEKSVSYTARGFDDATHVTIFSDGKELVRIDHVELVY